MRYNLYIIFFKYKIKIKKIMKKNIGDWGLGPIIYKKKFI